LGDFGWAERSFRTEAEGIADKVKADSKLARRPKLD